MAFLLESSGSCNRTSFFSGQLLRNCTHKREPFDVLYLSVFDQVKLSDESYVNHARIAATLASVVILLQFSGVLDGKSRASKNYSPKTLLNQWISNNCVCSKKPFVFVCLITFVLTLPLVMLLLLLAFAYREIVHFGIKKKVGVHFMGFMEGTDALWALEDDISLSVINVMALIKVSPPTQLGETASEEILASLRQRISERLLGDFKQFPKLFYKRCKEHGFAFWSDENDFDIEQYIRFVPSLGPIDSVEDTKTYIEIAFSELSNKHLLYDHTASWEILVAQRILEESPGDSAIHYIPVLIRMHHSLGDGVSLLRFFLEIIADKNVEPSGPLSHVATSNELYSRSPVSVENNINRSFKAKLKTMLKSPASLIYQAAFHQIDRNVLHPMKLSGNKVVCWRFENDDDNNLIKSIRAIKQRAMGVRFSDVILAALSLSIEEHIETMNCSIPNDMTVVHIARFAPEGSELKLQNRFSVGLQKIPILSTRVDRFNAQLTRVKECSERLRKSPDFLVNYWVISFMTSLLSDHVLAALVESVHSTIEFSNLPGPAMKTHINGHEIANITFWIPHRGSTGFGLSILSYGQKLQFGLIADRAVLPKHEYAQRILDRMVDEIKCSAASMTGKY